MLVFMCGLVDLCVVHECRRFCARSSGWAGAVGAASRRGSALCKRTINEWSTSATCFRSWRQLNTGPAPCRHTVSAPKKHSRSRKRNSSGGPRSSHQSSANVRPHNTCSSGYEKRQGEGALSLCAIALCVPRGNLRVAFRQTDALNNGISRQGLGRVLRMTVGS